MNRAFVLQVGFWQWVWRYGLWQFNKRVLRRDPWLRLCGGEVYRCPRWDPFAAEAYVTRGEVDWGAETLLSGLLQPHQTLLDVGAHTGYYARRLRPWVARVHLFEPDPRCVAHLRTAVADDPALQLWAVAVADHSGQLELCSDGRGFSHGSGVGHRYPVPCVRLDDHRHSLGEVGAIKVDVDGPDLDVLRGARALLAHWRPVLLLEIGNYDPAALWAELAPMDYRLLAPLPMRGSRFQGLQEVIPPQWPVHRMKMAFALPAARTTELQNLATGLLQSGNYAQHDSWPGR